MGKQSQMPKCCLQEKGHVERSLHKAKGRADKAEKALLQYKENLAAASDREKTLQKRLQATNEELREVCLLCLHILAICHSAYIEYTWGSGDDTHQMLW